MEQIYRGYPQGPHGSKDTRWMEYEDTGGSRNKDAVRFEDAVRRMEVSDWEKELYPRRMRRWQLLVEEVLDRMDRAGSAIYDEYPDREWLYRLQDHVIRHGNEMDRMEDQDAVLLLLIHELHRRRK